MENKNRTMKCPRCKSKDALRYPDGQLKCLQCGLFYEDKKAKTKTSN